MAETSATWFLSHPGACAALLRAGLPAALAQAAYGHGDSAGAGAGNEGSGALPGLLDLMLGASEAMFIAWGPERCMVYNDAYATILGPRHPRAMGQPLAQVWPEIWADIEPLVVQVFAGSSVVMDDLALRVWRDGQLRELHFTFSYHPVRGPLRGAARGESGTVLGLFCVCRETTSRLLAQGQREAEWSRRWRQFEQAPGFVAILRGPQHEIEFVNRAFQALFGPQDFIGQSLLGAFPDAARHGHIDKLDRVLSAGERFESLNVPVLMRRPGQPEQWRRVDFIFEPLLDDDTAVMGVFVQGRDVTDLHTAQESARGGSQRYLTLRDAMGECLALLDDELKVKEINRAARLLAGLGEAQVFGLGPAALWPGFDASELDSALSETLASAQARHLKCRLQSRAQNQPEPSERWLDMKISPVQGGLALLYRDISSVKLAEQALHQSQERFRTAVGAVGVMWTHDASGGMLGEQPGWQGLSGQSRGQHAGFGWVSALHPDDALGVLAAWQTGRATKASFDFEHRLRVADGPWRDYAVRVVPLLLVSGEVREWVAVHIDVTESRQAEQALRSAAQRKDKFLAVLAHELRNPLAPIRIAAQALGHPELTLAQGQACREVITRQVRHMAWLLDDLLEVSRITAGHLELKKGLRSLNDVVAMAVETARPALTDKAHVLTLDLPQPDIEVEVDDLRLSQVLSNLLINAAKYTPPVGQVHLAAHMQDSELVISVSDNGMGISAAQLPFIFEMFSQVREQQADNHEGLGIGLALARGLVELHGGELLGTSAGLGQGATFTVRLPTSVTESRPAPLPNSADARSLRTPLATQQCLSVLIADDNDDAAQSLGLLLGLDGHSVHLAGNGLQALALAAEVKPQVAVLDIGMPGLNGHELARQLRQQTHGKNMLIVAVTGWGRLEDQQLALAAGFDRHFTKPVNPNELLTCMAQWREQARIF